MAGPRFLLVSGVTLPDQPSRVWRGRPARGIEAERRRSARGVWTAWRLLGRNNRELGRSPGTFATVPECVASVQSLKACVDAAARLLSVDVEDGRWLWRLEVDQVAVAVSARSYQRQRECLYSLEQFLAGVAAAEPPAVLIELPSDLRPGAEPAAGAADGPRRPADDEGPPAVDLVALETAIRPTRGGLAC